MDGTDEDCIRILERIGDLQPAPDDTRRALQRVREALVCGPVDAGPRQRKTNLSRFAFAATVFVGIAAVSVWLCVTPLSARAGLDDVRAAMKSRRSVTFRQVTRNRGEPDETIRSMILDDGRFRIEEAAGDYTVIDAGKFRMLQVNTKTREATLYENWHVPPVNAYELIKNLPRDVSARALPGKKIGGKDLLGFVVKVDGSELTVWADSTNRLPMRIEAEERDDKGPIVNVVIDDFEFDKELDAGLFSFEPPAGYKVETKGTANFPVVPSDPKLKDLVVTPGKGIGPINFGMSREDVEKLLGRPDAVQEVGQGGFVIMNYGSRGLFVHVTPKRGVMLFLCMSQKASAVRVRDFSGKTDKGIGLGSSAADIVKAFGKPDSNTVEDGTTSLSYNKPRADFSLFGDAVVQMMFTDR